MTVLAAEYAPATGDVTLDQALTELAKKARYKKKPFIKNVSREFQIPTEQVNRLFDHYQFNVADVLMTLSIADVTGQPLKNISRSHFEHKKEGWKFTLHALDITPESREFQLIMKDIKKGYIHSQ